MKRVVSLILVFAFSLVASPAQASSCDREFLYDSSSETTKIGTVNVQIAFIDFANSTKKPKNYVKQYLRTIDFKEVDNYMKQTSYNKTKFNFRVDRSVVNFPKNSFEYGIAQRMNEDEENNYRDVIVASLEPRIDFSNIDVLWVVPDREIIGWHMALRNAAVIDGKKMLIVMMNVPSTYILIHELLHGLGLRDLYSGGGIRGVTGGMEQFSVMSGWNAGASILGYEKYALGWLGGKDVICHENGVRNVKLNSLDSKGIKLVLIPINDKEMLGVEYRKNEKRDRYLGASGTLVYHIDNNWNEQSAINKIYFGNKKNLSINGVNIKIRKNNVTVSK